MGLGVRPQRDAPVAAERRHGGDVALHRVDLEQRAGVSSSAREPGWPISASLGPSVGIWKASIAKGTTAGRLSRVKARSAYLQRAPARHSERRAVGVAADAPFEEAGGSPGAVPCSST